MKKHYEWNKLNNNAITLIKYFSNILLSVIFLQIIFYRIVSCARSNFNSSKN